MLPLLHFLAFIAMGCGYRLKPTAEYRLYDYYYGTSLLRNHTITCAIHSNNSLLSLCACAAVACRLLSYDAKSEAKELLSHAKSRSQLMRTEKGILVLLAASVDAQVWQVTHVFYFSVD